jgi:hypothetical protein
VENILSFENMNRSEEKQKSVVMRASNSVSASGEGRLDFFFAYVKYLLADLLLIKGFAWNRRDRRKHVERNALCNWPVLLTDNSDVPEFGF